jgi:hypothetical protein
MPENQRWDLHKQLLEVESEFSGSLKDYIAPSPAKTNMRPYCGDNGWTAAQYNAKIAQLNDECSVIDRDLLVKKI